MICLSARDTDGRIESIQLVVDGLTDKTVRHSYTRPVTQLQQRGMTRGVLFASHLGTHTKLSRSHEGASNESVPNILHRLPEKSDQQYFEHNFDQCKSIVVIFGIQHREKSCNAI